ncbi:unnamed protein product [Paramecium primaurelia]|uniref:Transmembrane protein n=1 Tax=Paramecium primaurelia TaxID=5886 RepID=A0A8S1NTX5_PARPR|nr:unnamed protein product [Paramecium primaurelia]
MNSEWQQMLIEDLNAKLLQRAELIGHYEELEELLEFHKANSTFEYSFAIKLEQLDKEIQNNFSSDQKVKSLIKERETLYQELNKRMEEQTIQVFEQYIANWISDFKGFRVIHGEEKYQQLLLEQQKQIKGMIYTQYNKKIQGITQIYKQYNQIDQAIQYNISYVDNDLSNQINQQQNKTNQSMLQKKDDTLQLSQIIQQIEFTKQIANLQQDDSLIQHMDEFNNIMTKSSHPVKLQTIYEEQQNNNNNLPIRQHHHSKTIFSHKHSTAQISPQMSKSYFVKETTLKKSLTKGTLLLKKFSNKPSKREFDVFQHQNPTQLGYGLRMAQLTQDRIEFRNQLKPQLIDSSLPLSQIIRVIIPKQVQGYLKRKPNKIQEKENNVPSLSYWPMQILTLNQGQIDLLFHSQDHMMDWYNGSSIHKHINHLRSGSGPLDTQLFVVGIVCISFSILLLWFNERRAAINSYRLQFARQHCISLTPFQESNSKDLIHITGQLISDELVTDKEFGVSQINCVKLYRNVEMYQWVQGDNKQQEQKWMDNHVENHFGYNNDKSKWVLKSETFLNQIVKLHQFHLEEDMKKELKTPLQNVKLNQANVQIAQQKYKNSGFCRFLLQDDYIYMHQVEDQIVNGDLRICFKQVTCSDATIVARGDNTKLVVWQFEDTFNQTVARDYDEHERTCCNLPVPNDSKPIKEIYWIFQGLFTPEECFSKVVNENAMLFWVFRSIGYILIAIGTIILLSPVSFLTDFIPTEKLTGLSFFIFGSIAALPITIFSICFSWVYYRPKIGFLMLLISIILGGGIFYYAYKNQ